MSPLARLCAVPLLCALRAHAAFADTCEDEQGALLQLRSETSRKRVSVVDTVTPTTSKPWAPGEAAKLMGMEGNRAGDLQALCSNFALNFVLALLSILAFCGLKRRFPLMYLNNVLEGTVEERSPSHFFGWLRDAWKRDADEVEEIAGLDAALLLDFCMLCVHLSAAVGLPLLCVLGPLDAALGGEHVDRLSKLGMGSVHSGHWLCWLHALLTWYVVLAAQHLILRAQRNFLPRRYAWLSAMPAPQSTTVLVECIPRGFRTDDALLKKFREMFGHDAVKAAYVVKDTCKLKERVDEETRAEQALHQAEYRWEKEGRIPERRPSFRGVFGELRDSIEYFSAMKEQAVEAIAFERQRIISDGSEEVCSSSGFVTFASRREQELALMVKLSYDEEEFATSLPPDPEDVLYDDLMQDPRSRTGRQLLGYLCLIGLYLGFTPFVLGGAQLTDLDRLAHRYGSVRGTLQRMGALAPLVESLAPVLALRFFMMFLPTFLMSIFRGFWSLRADAWAQEKLQCTYFWFLVVFELLITSVGSSLTRTTELLVRHPFRICLLLADTLPHVSHFYLNFLIFACGTHFVNLTRYFNLLKFLALKTVCKDGRARELAEPEDQDWYGLGGRSARFAETMVIGLVFANISPLMLLLTMLNFLTCRLVYGYLLVMAETRKPDQGGRFWVTQLEHLQKGLFIYLLTMVGLLLRRGHTKYPALLAVGAMLAWAVGYRRFRALCWESLPLQELGKEASSPEDLRPAARSSYVQPELVGKAAT